MITMSICDHVKSANEIIFASLQISVYLNAWILHCMKKLKLLFAQFVLP